MDSKEKKILEYYPLKYKVQNYEFSVKPQNEKVIISLFENKEMVHKVTLENKKMIEQEKKKDIDIFWPFVTLYIVLCLKNNKGIRCPKYLFPLNHESINIKRFIFKLHGLRKNLEKENVYNPCYLFKNFRKRLEKSYLIDDDDNILINIDDFLKQKLKRRKKKEENSTYYGPYIEYKGKYFHYPINMQVSDDFEEFLQNMFDRYKGKMCKTMRQIEKWEENIQIDFWEWVDSRLEKNPKWKDFYEIVEDYEK